MDQMVKIREGRGEYMNFYTQGCINITGKVFVKGTGIF